MGSRAGLTRDLSPGEASNGAGRRGLVDGLGVARPIRTTLPAIYQEDDFCTRLTGALDEVLAPVLATLDCLGCYLDPELAPEDFLEWLGGWVAVDLDETWAVERRRDLVRQAVTLYRKRGTVDGLGAHVRLYAGTAPQISESGGCTWSEAVDSPLPGSPEPELRVRLEVDDPAQLKRSTLERIIAASRPAHVPYRLDIVGRRGPPLDALSHGTLPGGAGQGSAVVTGGGEPATAVMPVLRPLDDAAPAPERPDLGSDRPPPSSAEGKEPEE